MKLTKLDEEKLKKKKSAEAVEKILATGEKGKKGVKYAKQVFKEEKKKVDAEETREKELLDDTKNIVTYNHLLANLLRKRLLQVDWPVGWSYKVAPTKIGVVFEMKSIDGRFFRRGFKPTQDPKYDLNAVDMYAVRAENTIDRITGADG